MEIIGKISKGSAMDQIYISKKRSDFKIGSYVIIKPLYIEKKLKEKLYFYNTRLLEPLKLEIINEIIQIINKGIKNENIIITGSFLDKGFNFNDIDVIVITEIKSKKDIEKFIENKTEIKTHIILINNKELMKGLAIDPLYQVMLSKCVTKKRFVYKIKPKPNYKILDLHLLKSKILVDNFDNLNGSEKYNLIRNMVAISLYLRDRKITKDKVDSEIEKQLNIDIKKIKQNIIDKKHFVRKYKIIYNKTFNRIMEGIKNGPK